MACGTVFSTNEVVADEAYSLQIIGDDGSRTTFSLPRLMFSLAGALGHRPAPISYDESYWLAQTVAQTLEASATDTVTGKDVARIAHLTLANFDATAGISYGARHGIVHNSAQRPKRGRPRTTRRGIN